MKKCVPITVVTGYLGSGKTTLINNILKNTEGYKIAVIVNDIGEINIDANLIEKGGIVNKREESLVPLTNGCICCTLKKDLMDQIIDILKTEKFDHILIEASGICEPIPIAQTITYLENSLEQSFGRKICKLDAVVSVVDAIRMVKEFDCGTSLSAEQEEESIESLVIQQIEFCDVIILNKVSDVTPKELGKVKTILKKLQPHAKLIEANYSAINISEILDTNLFDFERALTSAGWLEELDKEVQDDDDLEHEHHHDDHDDDHHHHHDEDHDDDHHHHHHHHHTENEQEGEAEEYGIGTYVYYRRNPFDRAAFENFMAKDFGRKIIRTKGLVYFSDELDMSYIYEQAGTQKSITPNGEWYAVMLTPNEIANWLATDPTFARDWDSAYGDRMIKLVFIGQHLNKTEIKSMLDKI